MYIVQRRQARHCAKGRKLTVKLRGRATTPDPRRGRTMVFGARGAKQATHHGPLQRLLDSMLPRLTSAEAARVLRCRSDHAEVYADAAVNL